MAFYKKIYIVTVKWGNNHYSRHVQINHKGHKESTKDTDSCELCETFVSFAVKREKIAHHVLLRKSYLSPFKK